MCAKPTELRKPLGTRMLELVRALRLVQDSLNSIRSGKTYHLLTLSGQLRALLTDRSKRADPLLVHLAKQVGVPLTIHCMPGTTSEDFPESVRDKVAFHFSGLPFSANRQFPGQQEVTIEEFLRLHAINLSGKHLDLKQLIDWYANKAGGAHYSSQVPKELATLLSPDPTANNAVTQMLFQAGKAVLEMGRSLLRTIIDVEIHAVLVIPSQEASGTAFLFDWVYPGSTMRHSLTFDQRRTLEYSVTGLEGTSIEVAPDRAIAWTKPNYIEASIKLQDDLKTCVCLRINGEQVGQASSEGPVFLLADPTPYDHYQNRAANGEAQDLKFGLGSVMMVGKISAIERAKLLLWHENLRHDSDQTYIGFNARSFGRAAPGERNIQMTGEVLRARLADYACEDSAASEGGESNEPA